MLAVGWAGWVCGGALRREMWAARAEHAGIYFRLVGEVVVQETNKINGLY
jgi:hypothetical protein